ncbi:MAG: tetratricopeptide repeat protein [Lentimicrobiaceae bacterium]|nr:tetratricopeptide repeat protein [Lentimicrobiaceae bacterium]
MEDFFNSEEEDWEWGDEIELVARYENMLRNRQSIFLSVDDYEQLYLYYMSVFEVVFPTYDEHLKKGGTVIRAGIAQYPDSEILQLLQEYHLYKENRMSKKMLISKLARIPFPDYEKEHFSHILAYIYRQIGERKKAFALFASMLEKTDDEEDREALYYDMMFLYENAENAPQAAECCEKILKFGNTNQEVLFGDMYWHFLYKPIAVPVFELLAKQYALSMPAWLYLGKSYFDTLMMEESVQAFRYAVAISDHPLPLVSLGRILVVLGEVQEAIECFEEAIRLEPRWGYVYTEMGEILFDTDDAERAMYFFSLAIDADPNDADALLGMALVLSSLERYEDSIAYIMRIKKINELPIEASLLLADNYIETDRGEDAVTVFQQLLKQYPEDVDVWLSYSNYYAMEEDFQQACAVAKQGLTVLEDDPFLLYRIANYCLLDGDIPQGIAYLRLAYHTNADYVCVFVDYDEDVLKIPEVVEIIEYKINNK